MMHLLRSRPSIRNANRSTQLYLRLKSTNGQPPQGPVSPGIPKKSSSSLPSLIFATILTSGSLTYLAVEAEKGTPMALHIADQPIISSAVTPFKGLIKLAGYGSKEVPAPVKTIIKHEEITKPAIVDTPVEEIEKSSQTEMAEVESINTSQPISESNSLLDEQTHNSIDTKEVSEKSSEDYQQANVDQLFEVLNAVASQIEKQEEAISSSSIVESIKDNTVQEEEDITSKSSSASPVVASLPVVSSETPFTQASTVANEIISQATKSSFLLRKELESMLLKDIETMDATSLRLRVTQLAAELFERLTWENLRLTNAVTQVESELTSKYNMLLEKQRRELEFEVQKLLFEREKALEEASSASKKELEEKYQQQLQQAIKAQAEGFQATLTKELADQAQRIQTELQDQLNHHVAMLRKSHVDHLLEIQPKIENLQASIKQYESILSGLGASVESAFNSHTLSTAILTLESSLAQPFFIYRKKFGSLAAAKQRLLLNFEEIKKLSGNDELIVTVIDTLPRTVKEESAYTLAELQVRFQIMREEARKAALAPEQAPKLIGQIIGTILANISFTPTGFIAGPGAEETLARAAYYLDRGKLQEALHEVSSLNGYAKVIAKDWIQNAEHRLLVDQTIQVLKAESILRHRNYSP
jgi:hypothetical protein